jgi:tripartite ATP-independent transporter DctM subunit
MTTIELGIYSISALIVLIYAGLYVPIAILLVSFASLWLLRGDLGLSMRITGQVVTESLQNYTFGVVPLFVLLGLLVSIAGLGKDSFDVAERAFRRLKGGLGVATVAASAVFAAITGISLASAAIFTRVAVPEMLRYGYQPRFAVGVVAGSSVLGMLIPPSLLFIIFGLLTEASVGHLFIAGILPGILLAAVYSVGIVAMARYWPSYVGGPEAGAPGTPPMPVSEIIAKMGPITALIVLVLGGIYGGVFTPTEAGAAGSLGALLIALAKRRLTWPLFWQVLMETGSITAAISLLVIGASLYSRMLALAGLPSQIGAYLSTSGFGIYEFLAIYIVIVVILGTVVDSVSIMLITLPLVLPALKLMNVDFIWFGVVTVVAVEIGLLTPPFGLVVFGIKSTLAEHRISLVDIFVGAAPFAVMMFVVLLILIAFPQISTALL